MDLTEKAYSVDYLGKPELVIDDKDLLAWAEETQKSPVDAQLEALEKGIIPLRYLKNFWSLNLTEQRRICASKVLICGCGGLGGISINLLARAGVGYLRMIDKDTFVPSNLNRQWACDTTQLSRPKAIVAAELVRGINPLIQVDAHYDSVEDRNVEQLIEGMDLVLDALDNIETRFMLDERVSQLKVPFIHAAVAGWWGQISSFLPGSGLSLEKIYGKRRSRDASEESAGILGPTASIIASLQAMEAIRILSGKPAAYAGRLFYFDGESGHGEFIPL